MGRKANITKKVAPFLGKASDMASVEQLGLKLGAQRRSEAVCKATLQQLGLKLGAQRRPDNPTSSVWAAVHFLKRFANIFGSSLEGDPQITTSRHA